MREVQTRNGKIRRYRTREEIAAIIREYQASGLSRAAFCQSRKLSASAFNRWLQRQGEPEGKPVFQELSAAALGASANAWAAEVVLVSGAVVRLSASASKAFTQDLWKLVHG